jgi:hypothetical protein
MEEIQSVESPTVAEPQTEVANPQVSDLLGQMWFGDKPTESTVSPVETKPEQVIEPPKVEEDEILDADEYIKRLGFDNEEAAKKGIEELRAKANQTSFEWANDDSRNVAQLINEGKLDDLYEVLNTRKQVDRLSKAEVNRNLAEELVKFGIALDNKNNPSLTKDDIDFIFSQRYSSPDKPEQADYETDVEYQANLRAWEQKVANIERQLIIDAKMQQPKLTALKSELVLPKIQQNEPPKPSQKDLDDFKAQQSSFKQSAEKSLKEFNGFSVNVKNKDVDYNVGYVPSNEERTAVDSKMKAFADSGFDANSLFFDRWLNKDGSININQVVKDYSRVVMGEQSDQKLAIDSANKWYESYMKGKKQTNVTSQPQGTFRADSPKSKEEAIADAFLRM